MDSADVGVAGVVNIGYGSDVGIVDCGMVRVVDIVGIDDGRGVRFDGVGGVGGDGFSGVACVLLMCVMVLQVLRLVVAMVCMVVVVLVVVLSICVLVLVMSCVMYVGGGVVVVGDAGGVDGRVAGGDGDGVGVGVGDVCDVGVDVAVACNADDGVGVYVVSYVAVRYDVDSCGDVVIGRVGCVVGACVVVGDMDGGGDDGCDDGDGYGDAIVGCVDVDVVGVGVTVVC